MRIHNLLSKAYGIFKETDDQEKLKRIEERTIALSEIQSIITSKGGEALRALLVKDFFAALNKLIETREDRYISDIQSIMDMINKLSVDSELKAIEAYLNDRLQPYEED